MFLVSLEGEGDDAEEVPDKTTGDGDGLRNKAVTR